MRRRGDRGRLRSRRVPRVPRDGVRLRALPATVDVSRDLRRTVSANEVLDVDLLAFERGSAAQRRAVVDGVMRSLGTGFVYTSHDLPSDLLDRAYGMLAEFFALDASVKA